MSSPSNCRRNGMSPPKVGMGALRHPRALSAQSGGVISRCLRNPFRPLGRGRGTSQRESPYLWMACCVIPAKTDERLNSLNELDPAAK